MTANAQKDQPVITFDAMDLHVGSRIQMVSFRNKKVISYSSIIGWEEDKCLLARMPQNDGVGVPISVGERVDVRFFSGISIYVFPSCVQFIYYNPRPFLELAFPDRIQHVPLRKDMRVTINVPVNISRQGQTIPDIATAVDLSTTGILLNSTEPLGEVGQQIHFSFPVRNTTTREESRISAVGTIRNNRAGRNDIDAPVYVQGISFDQMAQSDAIILQNYIYEGILKKRTGQ
ncbi:MAG: flagellar brake protein [Burkholderiaceae bacterium]|nr:flagellar brake protein [Burkholderiaceae bacterium]